MDVEPTVLAKVDNTMRVAQEEIFGPVLSFIAHDGDDDAVRIANDSALPLVPFGGFKESGLGRELGPEGLDQYLETKTIGLPLSLVK